MSRHRLSLALLGALASSACADEVLFRYEGDVLPASPEGGWDLFDSCRPEFRCSERIESGHFVIEWNTVSDSVNYSRVLGVKPDNPPPTTLWVEWRFRSNHPFPPND